MKNYTVLFTHQSIEPEDDSINIGETMLFGYDKSHDYWWFETAEAAHKEAKENDYKPGIDYIVVRALKGTK